MLPFDYYLSLVIAFFSNNIWAGVVLAVVILIFLYKKTEACIKCIGIVILIIAILYVMSLLTESGSMGTQYKMEGVEKSINEIEK